jgi:uncharacterized protein YndB with AHSA1/START domain
MTRIRQHAIIDASPEEVWAVVSNPRNLPRWNRFIRAVHDVPENGLRPGDRYWTEMGGFGVRFRVRAEVLEADPPRYSRVRLTGPLEAIVRTWIHPAGRRRSRLEHEVNYSVRGGPIGAVVSRALRLVGAPQMLKRGIRAQKRQAES